MWYIRHLLCMVHNSSSSSPSQFDFYWNLFLASILLPVQPSQLWRILRQAIVFYWSLNTKVVRLRFVLDLSFIFEIDQQNTELGLEQRVFFNTAGMPTTDTVVVNFSPGQEQCVIRTVYIFVSENKERYRMKIEIEQTYCGTSEQRTRWAQPSILFFV